MKEARSKEASERESKQAGIDGWVSREPVGSCWPWPWSGGRAVDKSCAGRRLVNRSRASGMGASPVVALNLPEVLAAGASSVLPHLLLLVAAAAATLLAAIAAAAILDTSLQMCRLVTSSLLVFVSL